MIIEPKEKNLWKNLTVKEQNWLLDTRYDIMSKPLVAPTWQDLKDKPRFIGIELYFPDGVSIQKLNNELPKSTNNMSDREFFVIVQELSLNYYRKL